MNGVEKEVDKLGRVVLPKQFRKKLGLDSNDKVLVSIDDSTIKISPLEPRCVLCGTKLSQSDNERICNNCINRIKETK